MKKFYLEIYGCKLNQVDSEIIRGVLKEDFEETAAFDAADFFVLNSCGVLEKTERKILKRAKELKEKNKKVIITGCLPLISPKRCEKVADGMIGPKSINWLLEVTKKALESKKIAIIAEKELDKLEFCPLKKKKDNCSVIIPICEGCLGNCSYCAAKLARGRLRSFDIESILNKIKTALSLGSKEIQLTGQDLSCYGAENKEFLLPKLLNEIVNIRGDFRVKVGMLEPYFLKKTLNDLIPALKDEKIYKFFYIPVQSGDNSILKKMKRKYKREDFLEIVDMLEKNFEDYLLATDIIVGFPGETQKAFENTLELIYKTKPQVININRFSPRPNTTAARLKDFPGRVKKERSRTANKLCDEIKMERNRGYLRKEFDALFVRKGKNNTILARNKIGKAIILDQGRVGEFKKVKIIDYKPAYLVGKTI